MVVSSVTQPSGTSLNIEDRQVMNSASGLIYNHWNIFFKDIYKVTIEIFDRETNKKISLKDLEQVFGGTARVQTGVRGE